MRSQEAGIPMEIFSWGKARKVLVNFLRKKRILLKETPLRFAAPEDVIIHKIFAGRARDLDDVKSIIIKNPSIELPYIEKWLAEFDKGSDEVGFSKKFKEILDAILKDK